MNKVIAFLYAAIACSCASQDTSIANGREVALLPDGPALRLLSRGLTVSDRTLRPFKGRHVFGPQITLDLEGGIFFRPARDQTQRAYQALWVTPPMYRSGDSQYGYIAGVLVIDRAGRPTAGKGIEVHSTGHISLSESPVIRPVSPGTVGPIPGWFPPLPEDFEAMERGLTVTRTGNHERLYHYATPVFPRPLYCRDVGGNVYRVVYVERPAVTRASLGIEYVSAFLITESTAAGPKPKNGKMSRFVDTDVEFHFSPEFPK